MPLPGPLVPTEGSVEGGRVESEILPPPPPPSSDPANPCNTGASFLSYVLPVMARSDVKHLLRSHVRVSGLSLPREAWGRSPGEAEPCVSWLPAG